MGLRSLEFFFTLNSVMINFSRQNLTSTDVRIWRLKSIPALYGLNVYTLQAVYRYSDPRLQVPG